MGTIVYVALLKNVTIISMNSYVLKDRDLLFIAKEKEYVLRVRDLPINDKPREKLIEHGPTALSEVELLAIVLNAGTRKEEIFSMVSRILKPYGENVIVNQSDPKILEKELEIPLGKACQIVASFELGRRFFKQPNGRPVILRTPRQVFEHLKEMGNLPKEYLRGLYLDSRHRLVHDEVISIGSLTANIVHPREVFRPALEHQAVAVIIAHNHPSGVLRATREDVKITEQLAEAGKIMGIDLLDHIIIGKNKFVSILEN